MTLKNSPFMRPVSAFIAYVYLAFCLAPSQFGISESTLPKLSLGPESAHADGDVSDSAFGNALQIGRAVRQTDSTGTKFEVRYVVSNSSRSLIKGARLGLTMANGVTLDSAVPEATRSGADVSFSVGDLSGPSIKQFILRYTTSGTATAPLDFGAVVFASIDGVAVSSATVPAIAKSSPGEPALYTATVDANSDDPYVIAQAGKLDHDPARIFAFVRDTIRNEVYSGSLRGARGALFQGAANSLDKSSLLIAMLRASGFPARYVQGTLDDSSAKLVILSMFPPALNLIGYIAAGAETADPASDPELLFHAKQHTWVEFDPNQGGFQALDPSFSNAQPGNTFAPSSTSFSVVPDSQRHRVTLRVKAETTIPSLLGGSFGGEATVLEASFSSVELVGRPIHLQHQVEGSQAPVPTISYTSFNYSPYLIFDRTDGATEDDELIRGTDYQEVITSFPFGSQILTGVFLDIDTTAPDGLVTTTRKTVLDRIGFDIRQHGGTPSIGGDGQAALNAFDVTTVYVSTGGVPEGLSLRRAEATAKTQSDILSSKPQLDALLASNPTSLSPEQQAFATKVRELQIEALRQLTTFIGEQFLSISSTLNKAVEASTYSRIYADSPRLIVITQRVKIENNQGSSETKIDLLKDGARIVLAKGQSSDARLAAGMQRGIAENIAETSAMEIPGLPSPVSTNTILLAAKAQNIPMATLSMTNAPLLEELPLSAQAKARISQALATGKLVLVPSAMVSMNGVQTVGWYETDGQTGETIGVLEDGSHGSGSIEWGAVITGIFDNAILATYFFFLGFLGGFTTVFFAGMVSAWLVLHDKDVKNNWYNNLNGIRGLFGLGGLDPRSPGGYGDLLPKAISALAFWYRGVAYHLNVIVAASLMAGFAAGVEAAIAAIAAIVDYYDPPIEPQLSNPGEPLEPLHVARTTLTSVATLASGAVQASQQSRLTEVRGQISSTWTGPITIAAGVSSLNVGAATVLKDGQPFGAGVVELSGATTVQAGFAVAGSLEINGDGALSFFGPSTALLGSSGSWKQFGASAVGGVTIELETDRLSLNGALLPIGRYQVQSSSATFGGSGAGLAANFVSAVQLSLTSASVRVGPGAGSLTVAGNAASSVNGYAVSSFTGTVSIASSGDADTTNVSGTAGHVALLTIAPQTVTTDQNTSVQVAPSVISSLAGDFSLTARAPPGWILAFTADKKLEITPKGGLQAGTVPVFLSAVSNSDGALLATAQIDVTIGAVSPGVDLSVIPNPVYTVAALGANIPSAFNARLKNLGPVGDTFALALTQAPVGFEARIAGTSLTVPPGRNGDVGIYLFPTAPLPAPGTVITFELTATSSSNAAITDTAVGTFVVPEIHAVAFTFDPIRLSAAPGGSASTSVKVTNNGNVSEPNIELNFSAAAALGFTQPASPLNLGVGGSSTQDITVNAAPSAPLNSSLSLDFALSFGSPSARQTFNGGIGVQIEIPGAGAANDAALEAALLGDNALSQALRTLGLSVTDLYLSPNDPVQQGLALSSIQALMTVLGSDEFAAIRDQLQSIYDAIASGDPASILSALGSLTSVIEGISTVSAAARAHNFRMYLLPNTQIAQPSVPTPFAVVLQNVGTQSTTISLSLGSLPAGVTSSSSNSPVTLAPGQTTQLPVVSITNSGANLIPFQFNVFGQVTNPSGAGLTHSTQGSLTSRTESVQVVDAVPSPAFLQPGGFVTITGRAIAALNTARTLKFYYTVEDGSSQVIFTSTPVANDFGTDNALQFINSPNFDTSFLPDGQYTVRLKATENDGAPIAGTEGVGAFYIGSPVDATLSVQPDQVGPGNTNVQARLNIVSAAGLGTELELLGQTSTFGARGDFVIKDNLVYIAGGPIAPGVLGESGTIVNITDPSNPVALSQFPTGPSSAFVFGGNSSDVLVSGGQLPSLDTPSSADTILRTFGLADPLAPNELTAAPLRLLHRQYFIGLSPHGNRVYSIAGGYRFFISASVFSHWGSVSLIDVTNPGTPNFTGSLYTTTIVDPLDSNISSQGSAGGWSGAIVDVSDTVVYHLTTDGPQNNPDAGPGAVRIFNLSNPANPVFDHSLSIPGTAQILGGYRAGNQVLLTGATGSVSGIGTPNVNGSLVLTVLDVSNPLNPIITSQIDLPTIDADFVTRPVSLGNGQWLIGDNVRRITDGIAVFGIADTSVAGEISFASIPSFPGATTYFFHVVGDKLYVVDSSGLKIFSLARLSDNSVSATVDVPNGSGVSVVPNSFSLAPSSVVDNGTFTRLTWNSDKFPPAYQPFDRTITWQLAVTDMKAVEARKVLSGGDVQFTYSGAAGDISLPPIFVSSGFTLFLDPSSSGAAPGGEAYYNLQVVNSIGPDQTYNLSVIGIDPDWVTLPAQVTVASGNSEIVPLLLRPDVNAAEAEYSFTVLATPSGRTTEFAGSVQGELVVSGDIVRPDGIPRGVVLQLTPISAIAGQAVPARYRVRVTNTGLETGVYSLSASSPNMNPGFPDPFIVVPPGASNFRETTLDLSPQPGVTSGQFGFTVTAELLSAPSVRDSANGTVTVIGNGVGAFFTPASGASGSQLTLRVTNSGTTTDTFALSLAGPAAPFSTLGTTTVTVASGASADVPVTVGSINFDRPGGLDLFALVVSQSNSAAQATARAAVSVSARNSFTVTVVQPLVQLNQPGGADFFVYVRNTGNTDDSYSLKIVSMSADTKANLVDSEGDPSMSIPVFRIPGGSTGGYLLKGSKPTIGTGVVTVEVQSLERGAGSVQSTGTIVVNDPNDLCPSDPNKSAPGICGCGTADTDSDGDGTANCLDGCASDPAKTSTGVCGCGVADSDANNNQKIDCLEPPPCSGACVSSNTNLDEDGDGVTNCTESVDKTDACDSGSFVQKLLPVSCAGANAFLSQVDIATVVNKLNTPLGFRVEYRDSNGSLRGDVSFSLPPLLKRDLIINDMGLVTDTYGTVCVMADTTLSGAWSGGLTLYKPRFPDGIRPPGGFGEEFDFALYYPFENPQRGTAALTLNTNSIGTDGRGLVANWVRLTDGVAGNGVGLSGHVRYYDSAGKLAADDAISLPDGGRFDFPAHERIGVNQIGLAEFVPDNSQSEFYFEASRYFYEGVGATSRNFYTAYTIPRRPLTGAAVTARTPLRQNEISIIELINGSSNAASATVRLFGAGGVDAGNESEFIASKGSYHRILLDISGSSTVETAEVSGPPEAIGATTLSYVFDKNGGLLYGYAQPFAESAGVIQFTEFNSFIKHRNTLELSNSLDKQLQLDVKILGFDNSLLAQFGQTLLPRANASIVLPVPADSYGTVVVNSGADVGVIPLTRVERPDQYVLSFTGR